MIPTRSNLICCENLTLDYYPHFFARDLADHYLEELINCVDWQEESYSMYGKTVKAPRLMAWYGEADAIYNYSGIEHKPHSWISMLINIKNILEKKLNCQFNSVLANFYRDGQDSMGWHADNECELGKNPIIASVSFGAEREFCLRHKKQKSVLKMRLEHGSVLLMQGETQDFWKHALPKSKSIHSVRVNLTFRKILITDNAK